MKGYKGFHKDMTCGGSGNVPLTQYESGKEYKFEGKVKVCGNGYHACEAPLDVFGYYSPVNSRYCEVDCSGDIAKSNEDSKIACTQIKIGAEIGIIGIVKAHIEYVKSHTTTEHTDPKQATAGDSGAATAGDSGAATAGDSGAATAGDSGAATAGNYGAATAGDYGAATAGDYGAATAGDSGAATAGYRGAATAGYRGAATAGNYGAATAGNYGVATAGDSGAATAGDSGAATAGYRGAATAGYRGAATAGNYGAATAGDYGAATARGTASVGRNGCALVRGNNVKARGGLGSILVICEENVKKWKAAIVDGEKIKADTYYRLELESGEFVEAGDE